jgi:hypothetical protein
MHACRVRCRSAIFEFIVIGPLRIEQRGAGGKIRCNHVGEDGARLGEIEIDERRVHGDLSKLLAPSQEFRVDCTNLVERSAQGAEIADQIGDLFVDVVWNKISALPAARSRLADGQISFGPVSRSVDAVAVLSAAALVCFDQCSTQNLFDRRQVAHDSAATSAQRWGRKILDVHRTESHVRPNESKSDSSVNLGSVLGDRSEEFSKRDQAKGVDEQRNGAARSLPARRRPVGPLTWHCE